MFVQIKLICNITWYVMAGAIRNFNIKAVAKFRQQTASQILKKIDTKHVMVIGLVKDMDVVST